MKKLIYNFSVRLSTEIKKYSPNLTASADVLRYGLEVLINIVSIIGLTIIISFLTGNTNQAIISMVSLVALKKITGGIHFKANEACIMVSVLTFTVIPLIDLSRSTNLILNAISLVLIIAFAPIGSSDDKRLKAKFIGCIIILLSMAIGYSTITVTFFAQALTLFRLKGGEKK